MIIGLAVFAPTSLHAEAMLQYFNTSWNEIALKMPELAEAGYDSLWLPPPTKGSGGLSVGYDLFDRFDLGSKDQRGTVSTRYGTEADLINLITVAHRFGIRVYFDNVMNHNAFDVPGYSAGTPIDIYPGLVPEDFHLRLTSEGYYRKWDNIADWSNTWQIQHRNFSDLIDLAQEPGTTNQNFGLTEGSTFPKISLLRQPNNPEYYCFDANGNYVGFGANNGLTATYLQAHASYYSEYVQDFLNRSARWILDRTKADGLRLDAVKHVPYDFFAASYGSDKDYNDYGYLGQAQRQFNLTHGFNDSKFNSSSQGSNVNLRESLFDTEKPRHNAMMFGEHLGEPPAYGDYFNVGMRLVDNALQSSMNGILGNPSSGLQGLDSEGSYGFGGDDSGISVMYAQSHDNDYASRRELQHALYLTRAGLGNIYTDGNHQAQVLSQSGGAFPRHANTNFLGQYGDGLIPNLLYIHNQFARGYQVGRWSDADLVAYERIDKRENSTMLDADGVTMLFLMNDNYANGIGINDSRSSLRTSFPAGAYLWQYASGTLPSGDPMNGFYTTVGDAGSGLGYLDPAIIVPKGGYFAFSWRNPEESDLWSLAGGTPLTILQNGAAPGTLTYLRKDGPDGDPNFNPYNVSGAVAGSYSYPYTIPRVTNATDLTFIARTDGSAENILIKLDGGIDLNGTGNSNDPTGKRDNPPALTTDVFIGYEQPSFVEREGPEKFAAIDTTRCTIGSAGAETYTSGAATVNGTGNNPQYANAATLVYHDPAAGFGDWTGTHPATQLVDSGSTFEVWAKTNSVGAGFRMFLYYTTDGTNPEGAGGVGIGTTKTIETSYQPPNTSDGNSWWTKASGTRPAGTLKYKVGIYKSSNNNLPLSSVFPSDAGNVALKKKMMTTFQVAHFNPSTAVFYPHNDFGNTQTGLSEGFHVLRARAFLKRDGTSAGNGLRSSIFNTFTQAFYYDAQPPAGAIAFPQNNGDTIGGSQYGVVVRTDPSITEVWYKIIDNDSTNDDSVLTTNNGNGVWVKASSVTPGVDASGTPFVNSPYPNEWRFNYINIPPSSTGTAQIIVRLRELSSADMTTTAVNDASADAASHWTTLVRTVNVNGPDNKLFVAFPQNNGDLVDSNYILKVWFSKALGDNTTTAQLLSRFVINIKSSDSPSDTGVVQPQSGYSINYNVTNDFHELAYQLPNLYNGNPDFLHTVTVTYTETGSPTLTGTRLVKARTVTAIQDNIVTPPEVDSDGKPYVIVLPDVANPTAAQRSVPIQVATDANATNVAINFTFGSGTVALDSNINPNPSTSGSIKVWNFIWTNVAQGSYIFTSTVTTPSGTAVAARDARVVFEQQVVAADPNKQDIDDDGLGLYGPTSAPIETTAIPLPTTNSDAWTNDQVHIWAISGKTKPLNPDTDNDELSDGLELGWATAVGDTNVTTDTNGDGIPNFQPDLDPPLYNTTDNSSAPSGYSYYDPWPYNHNNSRTDQIAGSVTDPTNPDTDGDIVSDTAEDLTFLPLTTLDTNGHVTYRKVHNGRVDILPNGVDDESIIAHPPSVYNTSMTDRTKVLGISPNAAWLETDPNNVDTDGDGEADGQEDINHNGIVDLAIIDRTQTDSQGNFVVLATLNDPRIPVTAKGVHFYYLDFCYSYTEPTDGKTYYSTALSKTKLNAVFRPGGNFRSDGLDVIWLETDPRRYSTTGDGLPDGWKIAHGLDPFDDGVPGDYNLHTGKVITDNVNGPNGDPDGDGFTNLQEFVNGTDPRVAANAPPPPAGSITVGPGVTTTVGTVVNQHEFTDWTENDLIALDPYDGDGGNFSQGDIYHAYDGFDSSRDMVAFYAHDGGAVAQGGDGNFYFRVDMQDLIAYAEQGNLDIYVVINFGNSGTGEYNLPDEVDTGTTLKWQAVVAAYQTNVGRVYLWDQNSATHSTAIGQNLTQFGVTYRDQNSTNGFKKAYYSSDLDAVEFSISRQALLDAGWNGDASALLYQVFTTKDGTQDSPQGAGDIGGRSDIRDSIRNDWIASDYYNDQANITGANSILRSWIGINADNDRGKRVKVMSIIHGNQAIQPGTVMQDLVNTGQGAGYYRPLDAHQAYGVPLSMHITPTLASAIQWAKVDPNSSRQYRDGPALNARITSLISVGTIDLLASTFSDHILPYFDSSFNANNVALSNQFLTSIYGSAPSSAVFWTPERVSDHGVLQKVSDLGYNYTFVDQMRHVFKWFGRSSALGDDGYRINQINNSKAFIINDGISTQLFSNDDKGLPVLLRQLLNRKARAGQQDQVVTFVNQWEDFAVKANADAYDKNIRWLANHPWVELVTPDAIVSGQVPTNSGGSTWGTVSRGTGLSLANVAKDFVDHAEEENYGHWYNGSSLEESLNGKVFNIRTGVSMPTAFGLEGSTGIVNSSWQSVSGLAANASNSELISLARATIHAAEFETAFHNQTANDLSKYSTGAYINPDTSFQNLAGFSKIAQSQTREAAIYSRVNAWATAAAQGNYSNSVVTEQSDVDLDGENEYMIFNDRLFALFERIGGRMTGAWMRNTATGYVTQVAGNFASYAGSETEEERGGNFASGAVNTFRTSGFKDWFAKLDNTGNGTFQYVDDYYSVTAASSGVGWKLTSSDGKISKTITLATGSNELQASYTTSGFVQLYIRFGLSPDLIDLLTAGQSHLGALTASSTQVDLTNTSPSRTTHAYLRFGGGSLAGASYNVTASDIDTGITADTVNMRNQAQTQQVELQGNGSMTFALGFDAGALTDSDGDGIPDAWTQQYFGHPTGQAGDLSRATDDPDGDGLNNLGEYIVGGNPTVADAASKMALTIIRTSSTTVRLTFSTISSRTYRVYYSSTLTNPTWTQASADIAGDGAIHNYLDDGSGTGSPPTTTQRRYYKLQVSLP